MRRISLLALFGLLYAVLNAAAIDRYVAPGGTDSGSATNASNPWATLTYAVDQANSNDTIHVAAGTYTENEIYVRENMTICGAGADSTIVQADTSPGVATNCVFRFRSGHTFTLADLTVRYGRTLAGAGGGGIRNDTSSLTLTRVAVVSNAAADHGGGIYSQVGELILEDCRIVGNSATNNGGGIEIYRGILIASNTTISGNQTAINGGGFYNNGGTGVFNFCTVSSNTAATNGGGLAFSTPVAISNCTVSYNRAGFSGGGLFNNATTGTAWSSSFIGNYAAGATPFLYGGGAIANLGQLGLVNCTLSGNSAKLEGGGIRNDTITMALTLRHCTVAGNSATNRGGGLYSTTLGQLIVLDHTLVGVNNAPTSPDLGGAYWSEDYNLIQNTGGATFNGTNAHNVTGKNPLLGSLQDNGGPTWTHAPATNSPALNAGDPSFSAPPPTDQRGAPRVQNGRIDIGAFERLEPDQDGDGMDGEWEFAHGLCPTNAGDAIQNPDGDPFVNLAEYTADTDPLDPASYFHVASIAATNPVTVGFHSSSARTYDLEWDGDLAGVSWNGLPGGTNIPGNGGLFILTDTNNPLPPRYYRVKVRVP
jgi:predicted outer membrane repeat protein